MAFALVVLIMILIIYFAGISLTTFLAAMAIIFIVWPALNAMAKNDYERV